MIRALPDCPNRSGTANRKFNKNESGTHCKMSESRRAPQESKARNKGRSKCLLLFASSEQMGASARRRSEARQCGRRMRKSWLECCTPTVTRENRLGLLYCLSEASKLRPAGQTRPAKTFCHNEKIIYLRKMIS